MAKRRRNTRKSTPPTKQPAPRLLLLLSDLHVGSTVGICPPDFQFGDGNSVGLNDLQAFLWQCWGEAMDWITATCNGDPYVLGINGDTIEGNHHGARQVWSTEIEHQEAAAEHILRPLAVNAHKTIVVEGTECHTGASEARLGWRLGAEKNPATGQRVWKRGRLRIAGCNVILRHHMPTTGRSYLEASQLSIQLGNERAEAARNREPIPDVLCMAHRHRFGVFDDDDGMSVVTPPWQGLTRFGHKVASPARLRPGVVLLDWRGIDDGDVPVCRRRIFRPPHAKEVTA